jgi:hypothetical protein
VAGATDGKQVFAVECEVGTGSQPFDVVNLRCRPSDACPPVLAVRVLANRIIGEHLLTDPQPSRGRTDAGGLGKRGVAVSDVAVVDLVPLRGAVSVPFAIPTLVEQGGAAWIGAWSFHFGGVKFLPSKPANVIKRLYI